MKQKVSYFKWLKTLIRQKEVTSWEEPIQHIFNGFLYTALRMVENESTIAK